MALKVMILGANGFIGSALTNAILRTRDWEVYGMDLSDHKLTGLPSTPRFHFVEGDITINQEWVEYHVKKCDAILSGMTDTAERRKQVDFTDYLMVGMSLMVTKGNPHRVTGLASLSGLRVAVEGVAPAAGAGDFVAEEVAFFHGHRQL